MDQDKLIQTCKDAYHVCASPEATWLAKVYACQDVNTAITPMIPAPDEPEGHFKSAVTAKGKDAGSLLASLSEQKTDADFLCVVVAFHAKLCAMAFG